MLNPEIFRWYEFFDWLNNTITYNFDPQQVADSKRQALLNQVSSMRKELLTTIAPKITGEVDEVVSLMITGVENSCQILLVTHGWNDRSIAGKIVHAICDCNAITANLARGEAGENPHDKDFPGYKKTFAKQINAIRIWRKLIHRETLGDKMDDESRETVNIILRLLRNVESIIRKLFAILFREYKDAIKAYDRKCEDIRRKRHQEEASLKQAALDEFSSVFTMERFDQWAERHPTELAAILEKYSNK